jgi:hypothetical protein
MTQPPIVPGHQYQPYTPPPGAPPPQQATAKPRMPGPILGALLLLAAIAAFGALNVASLGNRWSQDPAVAYVWTAGTLIATFAAAGTWQRWTAAQATAIGLGLAIAGGGLWLATVPNLAIRLLDYDNLGLVAVGLGGLIVALVVVPQSSRDWYG